MITQIILSEEEYQHVLDAYNYVLRAMQGKLVHQMLAETQSHLEQVIPITDQITVAEHVRWVTGGR